MKKAVKIAASLVVMASAYWFSFHFPMSNEYLTFMYFVMIIVWVLQKER